MDIDVKVITVHYAMRQMVICAQLQMESPLLNLFNALLLIIELASKIMDSFVIIQETKYGAIHF